MLRKAPAFWRHKNSISTLLLPAAALYGIAACTRNALTRPLNVGVPVICVGNLTAGGAGKTPVALALAEMVLRLGKKPFFLSRGYGGALAGPLMVDAARHTASEVGDEPLLLAAAAPAVVAKDRLRGARLAIARGAEVIIMDDGFQNPTLCKDFSLLVVDGTYKFGNERLLPAGPLREAVTAGVNRADAVLVVDGTLPPPGRPLLHAALVPENAPALRGKKVAAFAGLGQPEKFRATLQQLGCDIISFTAFADHHHYREPELAALKSDADIHGAALVTTAKDAVRLSPAWKSRVEVVLVRIIISETEQLEKMLYKAICNIS